MESNLLAQLARPFHPSVIEWKPGAATKDGTKAIAMPYADLRAYQNRLDEVCGLDWSVTYTPWGDRIVCHLTINGVTRSSVGEADSQSEKSEIAGTAAEAQAFKRAAAMFGLGRYLYGLPIMWVEYNKEQRRFTEEGLGRLSGAIYQHYKRSLSDGEAVEVDPLRVQFDQLGKELYGDQWAVVARKNAERISEGKAVSPESLTSEQIQKLIQGMKSLLAKRAEAGK